MTSNKSQQHPADWEQFEADVQTALEAAGYKVQADVLLGGCQIDLYAHRQRDLFTDRLLVECKALAKPVGVKSLREFSTIVDTVSSRQKPVRGLFVSTNGFTKSGRAFSRKAGIETCDLADLIALSFDPSPIISHTITWFESSELGPGYVPLSCQIHEFSSGTVYKPVERFLDEFFNSTKKHGLAVLGNFGTGKTSLCRHYAYLLAKRWEDPKRRSFLPIYINLRDARSLLDMEQTILKSLIENYETRTSQTGLEMWLRQKSTLLFLDGFDEMAARMDRVSIDANVRSLSRFSTRYNCKILLTCRTHFFRTQVDEKPLARFMRLYMRDWGSEELEDFVGKRMAESADRSLQTIRTTYNLEELAKTPIFLHMITNTIADLGDSVSQAKLYQVTTDRWIEDQDYRSHISSEDKRNFMEALAHEMFVSGESRVSHNELPERTRRILQDSHYVDAGRLEEDIRTCSFLVRNPEGQYYFVHRSYMEFFVGARLARKVKQGETDELQERQLPPEIAGFMANYFESDWEVLLRQMIGESEAIARANCALILGELPRRPQVQDALLLALDAETDELAKESLVRALLRSEEERGIDKVVSLALQSDQFSAFCVEELGVHIRHPSVISVYQRVLENEYRESVLGVLKSIERHSATMLRDDIRRMLDNKWWKKDTQLVAAMFRVIDSIADTDLAVGAASLLGDDQLDKDIENLARTVRESLGQRVRRDIQLHCRELHDSKLPYPKTEGRVRRRFGLLIDDVHLKTTLTKLYGASEAAKAEGSKGSASGGSRGARASRSQKMRD